MKKKLVFFEGWPHPIAESILKKADQIELHRLSLNDPESLNIAHIREAHGLHLLPATELTSKWYPTRNLLKNCKNLLAISSTGAGYDFIDVEACTDAGILVVNNSGANAVSVSQHVLGMILALSRNIIQLDRLCRKEKKIDRMQYVGRELTGKTIGIMGLGNVGSEIAQLAHQGFGMKVIAYDPYIQESHFNKNNVVSVEFDTLFSQADYVSINCPLTSETRGMIDERVFRLMKRDAFFVTTARGGIHDEKALEQVLDEGLIAGAGLDVFSKEPPEPGNPLMRFNNVIITPHIAGITDICNRQMGDMAARQWIKIFSGQKPLRAINPIVWPIYRKRYFEITGSEIIE